MHPEKEKRICEMIEEYKSLERLLECDIMQKQARLHEHRRRRDVLEEMRGLS